VTLSPEEKARRKRDRMIEKAEEMSLGTYSRKFVAPVFQAMIRAEAAAKPRNREDVIMQGVVFEVIRDVGECVCVTCGKLKPWKNHGGTAGGMDTGHFLAGGGASIVFEETNAHPQCVGCNQHLSGNQGNYTIWMQHVYGQDEIDRLKRLKAETRQFTREELVDLKIEYKTRLDAAIARMQP